MVPPNIVVAELPNCVPSNPYLGWLAHCRSPHPLTASPNHVGVFPVAARSELQAPWAVDPFSYTDSEDFPVRRDDKDSPAGNP